MDLQVIKMKVDIMAKAKLSHRSLSSPLTQRQITHSPKLSGKDYENIFQNALL